MCILLNMWSYTSVCVQACGHRGLRGMHILRCKKHALVCKYVPRSANPVRWHKESSKHGAAYIRWRICTLTQ